MTTTTELFTTQELDDLRMSVWESRKTIRDSIPTYTMQEVIDHATQQCERLTDLLTKLYGIYTPEEGETA